MRILLPDATAPNSLHDACDDALIHIECSDSSTEWFIRLVKLIVAEVENPCRALRFSSHPDDYVCTRKRVSSRGRTARQVPCSVP